MARSKEDDVGQLAPTHTPSNPPPVGALKSSASNADASQSKNGADGKSGSSWDKSPPVLHVGRVLAERWRVGDRIGMGGMASVHQGEDLRLGRNVAIKILHPHVAENADARTRLAREARAIAQLKHESVIEVYDYSIDDPECTWLVTELIEGASLREVLDVAPPVMPEVAAMLLLDVLRALRSAHQVGIVHRDVKPDNILVGKAGRPKLSDFGIAQIVDEQRMTITGNLVGSPSYMSPEQAEGRRTDHRTDLFSAGVLLYRLVTGRLPFKGANAIETLRKVAALDFEDPTAVNEQCPKPVAGVIRRAMAVEIDDRYQTADEMLQDLARITKDAGLGATAEELPKFFADPEVYQVGLSDRLAKELFSRGKTLLDRGDESRALDCFDRAKALGLADANTHEMVAALTARRKTGRLRRSVWSLSVGALAVLTVSGVLLAMDHADKRPNEADVAAAALDAEDTSAAEVPELSPAAPKKTEKLEVAREKLEVAREKLEVASEDPAAKPDEGVPEPAAAEAPPKADRRKPKKRRNRRKRPAAAQRASAPAPGKAPAPAPVAEAPAPAAVKEAAPKPAAEAPAPARGSLQIGMKRWANIYIDGQLAGQTPRKTRYDLPEGEHEVRAANPHCDVLTKKVRITAGQRTRVRLELNCRK